jgi:hypothetical protein
VTPIKPYVYKPLPKLVLGSKDSLSVNLTDHFDSHGRPFYLFAESPYLKITHVSASQEPTGPKPLMVDYLQISGLQNAASLDVTAKVCILVSTLKKSDDPCSQFSVHILSLDSIGSMV